MSPSPIDTSRPMPCDKNRAAAMTIMIHNQRRNAPPTMRTRRRRLRNPTMARRALGRAHPTPRAHPRRAVYSTSLDVTGLLASRPFSLQHQRGARDACASSGLAACSALAMAPLRRTSQIWHMEEAISTETEGGAATSRRRGP